MRNRNRTPLRVSIVAAFVAILVSFLFGGMTRADEAQSAAQSTTAQSVGATTVAVTDEAQSSNTTTAVAVTADNDAQSSSGSSVATAATTDSNCTPRPISAEEIQTSLKTTDGSPEYTAYEAVEFAVNLTLAQNHCAGDSITISVPSELGTEMVMLSPAQ